MGGGRRSATGSELEWLSRLQHSPFALEYCLSSLTAHGAALSFAACYFCATTCAFQLRKGGNFGDAELVAMRDALSQLLAPAAAFDRRLLTPVAACVVYLMVRMAPTLWEPAQAIESMCGAFGSSHTILIELLTLLPEEVGNKRLSVPKQKRAAVNDALRASSAAVIDVLRGLVVGTANGGRRSPLQTPVLRCFRSWVEFGAVPLEGALASGMLAAAVGDVAHPAAAAASLPSNAQQEATEAAIAVIAASVGGATPASPAKAATGAAALALLAALAPLAPLTGPTCTDSEQRRCALLILTSALEAHLPLVLGRRVDVAVDAAGANVCASLWSILASATSALTSDSDFEIVPTFWTKVSVALGPLGRACGSGSAPSPSSGELYFLYRYMLCESCSLIDSLPLTYSPQVQAVARRRSRRKCAPSFRALRRCSSAAARCPTAYRPPSRSAGGRWYRVRCVVHFFCMLLSLLLFAHLCLFADSGALRCWDSREHGCALRARRGGGNAFCVSHRRRARKRTCTHEYRRTRCARERALAAERAAAVRAALRRQAHRPDERRGRRVALGGVRAANAPQRAAGRNRLLRSPRRVAARPPRLAVLCIEYAAAVDRSRRAEGRDRVLGHSLLPRYARGGGDAGSAGNGRLCG